MAGVNAALSLAERHKTPAVSELTGDIVWCVPMSLVAKSWRAAQGWAEQGIELRRFAFKRTLLPTELRGHLCESLAIDKNQIVTSINMKPTG